MRIGLIILGVLLAFADLSPAHAGVSGPACVIDGDHLMINGKRWYGQCIEGTEFRLFGIVAPTLSQLCEAPNGRKWLCGRASAAMLLEAVKSQTVTCDGSSTDAQGQRLAVCYVRGEDLNRQMVRAGWALAYPRHSEQYLPDERIAAQAHRGLWQSAASEKFDWRNH